MPKPPAVPYDPKYCELAISMAKTGSGFNEIAAKIGIKRATLFRWQKRHEEFFRALGPAFKNDAWRKAIRKLKERQAPQRTETGGPAW